MPKLYKSLGCWKDKSNRALPSLEGKDARLKGNPASRDFAIDLCYRSAKARGFHVFAVQNGACYGMRGSKRYQKYGNTSTSCKNGKGGSWSNDVYQIGGQSTSIIISLGLNFLDFYNALQTICCR